MIDAVFKKDDTLNAIYGFRRSFKKNRTTFAKRMGRILAHRMHTWTLPISQGNGNMFPVERRQSMIERDHEIMYPAWEDDNWFLGAYAVIREDKGEALADSWWSAYRKAEEGYHDAEETYDPVSGDFTMSVKTPRELLESRKYITSRTPNDERYSARRKGMQGRGFRGGKDDPPIALVQANRRRTAAKRRKKRAGMAKAAWKQAADFFGTTKNVGKGKFKMKWDRRVNPVNRATGGRVGSGTYLASDQKIYVRVNNHIRYADEALLEEHYIKAIIKAEKQIKMEFELRVRAAIREGFKNKRNSRTAV